MRVLRIVLVCVILLGTARAEPIPFRRAIELALQHSGVTAIAAAEQLRAQQSYLELRNLYLPQVVVGSGLGYTNGFPLSLEGAAPAIFNVTTQQYVLNLANRDFMRAARTEWDATKFRKQDSRDQVMQETALTYIQLDQLVSEISVLRQQQQATAKAEDITRQRIQEGVDSQVELTRAQLSTARVRMRLAETQGSADLLRLRLAQLTGLPADSIETMPESIPDLPAPPQDADAIPRSTSSSPAVQLADAQAKAQEIRARGEHKQLLPMIDLAGQYAVLARFNNYDQFFLRFQRNNVTVGAEIRFPILNFSQRAHAEAADAEAIKARRQADGVREQVATETLKLQRLVRQLIVARDIAKLEHQLSLADVDAVGAKIEAGAATLRDQENARASEHDKYAAYLNASFELQKAQLAFLRATGGLENWALAAK
ncbi:MAG: TolC family protein [Acidobacteriia bacterium]|nr:TolC family protein [Terriglobia bacterium]